MNLGKHHNRPRQLSEGPLGKSIEDPFPSHRVSCASLSTTTPEAAAMRVLVLSLLLSALSVRAVTIYTTFTTNRDGSPILPTNTDTAIGPAYSGFTGTQITFPTAIHTKSLLTDLLTIFLRFPAYNLTKLDPPPLPNPLPSLNFAVQLYAGSSSHTFRPHPDMY